MSLQDLYTSFWSLESDGADEKGGMTLTNTNGVTHVPAKVGDGADMEAGSSQFYQRTSEATLQIGDIAAFWTAWVRLESNASQQTVFGKYQFGSNNREYVILYHDVSNRFQFTVSSDGLGNTDLTLSSSGPLSTGVWYFVACWHDPVANKIYGSVNDGAVDEIAHSGGIFQGISPFALGFLGDGSFPAYMDGIIDQAGFGKGVIPSASEITQLYNNGDGLSWAAMGQEAATLNLMGAVVL